VSDKVYFIFTDTRYIYILFNNVGFKKTKKIVDDLLDVFDLVLSAHTLPLQKKYFLVKDLIYLIPNYHCRHFT
jgi:hypothetical protein